VHYYAAATANYLGIIIRVTSGKRGTRKEKPMTDNFAVWVSGEKKFARANAFAI